MKTYASVARFPRQHSAINQAAATPTRRSRMAIQAANSNSPAYRSISVVTPQSVSRVSRRPAVRDISIDDATISTTSATIPNPAATVNVRMPHTPRSQRRTRSRFASFTGTDA